MTAQRQLDVRVPTALTGSETNDYLGLQIARRTAEDTAGVARVVGLVKAERSFEVATGQPILLFRFQVETR